MLNGGHKGFMGHVAAGAGLALGAVITLGIIKIVTRTVGFGSEFSYVGETQNTLNFDGPGRYDLS